MKRMPQYFSNACANLSGLKILSVDVTFRRKIDVDLLLPCLDLPYELVKWACLQPEMRSICAVISHPFHVILVSYQFDKTTPIAAVKHDHKIAVFQQLPTVSAVHGSQVCRTFGVGGKGKVHCHRTAQLVVVIITERLV